MNFDLHHSITILERTPFVLRQWLTGLPEAWTRCTEGAESWCAYDIVGHLIHGEKTDWLPRLRIILTHGTQRPFDPFDRFAQFENSKGKDLEQLLAEFAALRKSNLEELRKAQISESDMEKKGVHPAFGEVTLRQLLATWTVHDLGHIAQIARVMAKQYKTEVGPWAEYLPVLSK